MSSPSGENRRPNASPNRMYQFKLVLLGESAVGKSSLVSRFVKGQFHEYQESTIGGQRLFVNFHRLIVYVNSLCVLSPLIANTKIDMFQKYG